MGALLIIVENAAEAIDSQKLLLLMLIKPQLSTCFSTTCKG